MDVVEKEILRKRQMTLKTLFIKMRYIVKKENDFIKNYKYGIFSVVFVIKPRGCMTDIFSVGLQKTDQGLKLYKPGGIPLLFHNALD